MRKNLILLPVLFAAILVNPTCAVAQDPPPTLDQRFIRGLRERGLLELADAACRRQMVSSSQEEVDVWVGELLRVLAERAMDAEPQDRAALWREAEKLGDKFLRENEGHARAIIIRIQLALNHFARGENLRIQSELKAAADIAPALDALAVADRAYGKIDEELQLLIGRAGTRRDGELTRDDLFALQNQVVYDRARVAQQRALCYESGSDDRAAAMGEALEYLEDGLKRLAPTASLTFRMRIERATCFRELDDLETAGKVLAPLLKIEIGDELLPLLRCERMRQSIAGEDATSVQRSLSDQDAGLQGSVEWELARLEGAVFLWQSNKANPRVSQRWRNDALSILANIENQYGGYWARRANRTLIRSATGSADVAVLQRRADEFYLRGQLEEAIAAYDKAALAAVDAQDPEGQFLSMYRAARVVEQQDDSVAFRDRLKQITVVLPDHPSTDDAHLVLIRQLASAARLDQTSLKEYGTALETHLQRWPNENTADQVRIWAAIWAASQRDDKRAIDLYKGVQPSSEFFPDALDGLRGIWLQQLTTDPTGVDDALNFFATALEEKSTADSAKVQGLSAWSGTQLSLRFAVGQVEEWQPKLAAAWDGTDDLRLKQRMLPTQVAALAKTGQLDEANSLVDTETNADILLQVAAELAGLLENQSSEESANGSSTETTGNVLAQTIQKLRGMKGIKSGTTLDQWEATAATVSGDVAKAIKIYEQLLATTPADVVARQKLARLLTRSKDRTRMDQAANQWRIIAAGFRRGHDSWFEAKIEIARLDIRLDKKEEALKLVRYLLVTARPKEPWKSRFEALLK